MSFNNDTKRYLDGKKLFEVYWVEMGGPREFGGSASYKKLEGWCKANNMIHPVLGTVGRMGIWKSMWRWAVENQDESYAVAQKGVSQNGAYITKERWEAEMFPKMKTSYQNKNKTARWEHENAN